MLFEVTTLGGQIARIYFCPHPPEAGCDCRKPKPGMLKQIQADFELPLGGLPVVGDNLKDLLAANAVDALPILVLTGYGRKTLSEGRLPEGTLIFDDLASVTDALLGQRVGGATNRRDTG
jgi:D-glycero-D-manno-heptose 1,7-bisphosphate phosphatase